MSISGTTAAAASMAALQGANTSISSNSNNNGTSASALEDFNSISAPPTLISIQDRKDEALRVLKSDLMDALNKEVKSLDDDEWMFEGPRSRINVISRPVGPSSGGSFSVKDSQNPKEWNLTRAKLAQKFDLRS